MKEHITGLRKLFHQARLMRSEQFVTTCPTPITGSFLHAIQKFNPSLSTDPAFPRSIKIPTRGVEKSIRLAIYFPNG